jgi:exosome complex component CSL4
MSKIAKESGRFVVPGDKLGVVEEFTSGPGTYEKDGTIYSKLTGYMLIDFLNKNVFVHPKTRSPVVPREGALAIGVVSNIQGKIAIVNLIKIEENTLQTPFTGLLHISTSSSKYEENMVEVCKVGDIVRAKIINVKNRIPQLATIDKTLGVIYAFCSKCGHPLMLRNTVLQCQNCKNIERRKIAEDYGRATI